MTRPPYGGLFLILIGLYNFAGMPDDYLETKGELTGDLLPKKKKKHRWWQIVIDVVLIASFVAVAGISANVLYLSVNYGDAFFVDGASMYPTLNKDGLMKKSDGSYGPITWKSAEQSDGDYVDYGWARMGERGLSDLQRFDIAITYYPADMNRQSDGSYKPKSGASLKIKRVVAFPGETITIRPDLDENGNIATPWGTMTITKTDGTIESYSSFYSFDDFEDVDGETYRSKITSANQTVGPLKLADDAYFVLGDNRASHYSSDSRTVGAIPSYCLQGKAYVVTCLRKLSKNGDGTFTPVFALDKLRPIWNYIHLDSTPFRKTLNSEVSSNA